MLGDGGVEGVRVFVGFERFHAVELHLVEVLKERDLLAIGGGLSENSELRGNHAQV